MQPVLGITILSAGLAILFILALWVRQRQQAEHRISALQAELANSENARANANLQLQAMLRISHQFAEATGGQEIINMVVNLAMELTGAMGASFVALDQHCQPMGAIRQGEFPFPVPDAWLEYLASPTVRQTCAQCQRTETLVEGNCNLLKGPFSDALGLYCFPLKYGEKELGILNLYMPDPDQLAGDNQDFLRMLLDATALALEGEGLRNRELEGLTRLHRAPLKSDLKTTLLGMLADLQETLGIDFARLVLQNVGGEMPLLDGNTSFDVGELTREERETASGLIRQAFENKKLQSSSLNQADESTALLAAPLCAADSMPCGVLLLGTRRTADATQVGKRSAASFTPRQFALAQTVADQMALVVQAVYRLDEVQYRAMMDERTRLAREIHDGLAQTLAFLKLQVAQMMGYQERGDQERLGQVMRQSYDALGEAYRDVREAIDMLRIVPGGEGGYSVENWLRQIVAEFQENGALQAFKITISDLEIHAALPPEVHAQLIRIVQEALSNTRKHAKADQVWISCREVECDLVLEVRDNGQGFIAGDIPGPSRHGLRGMRERAELIGADFQVISRPGSGTTVLVRLPLDVLAVDETGQERAGYSRSGQGLEK